MRRRPLSAIALLVLAALLALAQSGEAEPAKPEDETLDSKLEEKVEVRLVEQRIVARDRQGRPVPGLTAEDFEVSYRRQKARVAFVEPLVKRRALPEDIPEVRLMVEAPSAVEGVATSENPPQRHVIIFVDVENDPLLRRPQAAEATARFVRERLQPGDRIAVFSYNGEIHNELLFSPDREAAVKAVMQAFARPRRPLFDEQRRIRNLLSKLEECVREEGAVTYRQADMRCVKDTILEYGDERRPFARDYVQALTALVRLLGGVEGDKVVLALTHGVAVDPSRETMEAVQSVIGNTAQMSDLLLYAGFGEGVRREYDALIDLAIELRVALSFIDRSPAPAGDAGARNSRMTMPGTQPIAVAHAAPQDDLKELAGNTGGVFTSSTDVFQGLSDTLDMEKGSYVIGYYLDKPIRPDRLTKVDIDCKVRGVRVSYRKGYYPLPEQGLVGGKIALGQARIVDEEQDEAKRTFLPFQVQVDPVNLGYEERENEAVASFSLHVRVLTDEGVPLADSYHYLTHAYPAALWKEGDVEPVLVDGWVELGPGRYELEASVHNPKLGRDGSFSRSILVANSADELARGGEAPATRP